MKPENLDLYTRFTLDTASEFLFDKNLDTLSASLPIPGTLVLKGLRRRILGVLSRVHLNWLGKTSLIAHALVLSGRCLNYLRTRMKNTQKSSDSGWILLYSMPWRINVGWKKWEW